MSRSPSFNIGVTSAIFQTLGNWAERKMALIIDVIEGRIAGRQSLMTQIGILSIPGDLFVAIELIIFCTWLMFTLASKTNCSDAGYSRGVNKESCASLEFFGQCANFLNCILTDVYKEVIEFVGHSVYVP